MELTFKTVEWIDDQRCLRMLNQRALPDAVEYLDLNSPDEVAASIADLTVRGAPAIGVAAAYGLALAVKPHDTIDAKDAIERLARAAATLKAARPTAVNLAWAVDRVMKQVGSSEQGSSVLFDAVLAEAQAIHNEDIAMCDRIGEYGQTLLGKDTAILTHCNAGALATTGIGTALAVVYAAKAAGKNIRVFADETRPVWQGARLTLWELKQEGIDAILLCDSASGSLMASGQIDAVITGADRIARNGDTANKIGTYNLAALARRHGIPFYIAAPQTTFDPDTLSGKDIPIEQRPAIEIVRPNGKSIAPEGSQVYAPAFDVTPNELITAFITDTGVHPGRRKD